VDEFILYVTEDEGIECSWLKYDVVCFYDRMHHVMLAAVHNGGNAESIPACKWIFEACIGPHKPKPDAPPPYFF